MARHLQIKIGMFLLFLYLSIGIIQAVPCSGSETCVEDIQSALSVSPQEGAEASVKADAFADKGLRPEVLSIALKAWQHAWDKGDTQKKVLTVIDYSLPSDQHRLWIIDLETGKLLFHERVAHGKNTGGKLAKWFSNVNNSKKSNLGVLKTAETYMSGKFGYSLRLDGLEQGFNHNARRRAIVMHRAPYTTDEYVDRHGRLGRSWGCPALDPKVTDAIIDTIKEGSIIVGYVPDAKWLEESEYLK